MFDLFHLVMSMTIMEVIAPASGCLIELVDNDIYRYRVHIPAGIVFDFLFNGFHGFVRGFNQWKGFSTLCCLDDANTESQESKPFLSGIPDLRFLFVELESKLVEDGLQNGISLSGISST